MLARLGEMLHTEKARWVRYGSEKELECDASKIKVLDVSIGGLRILSKHQFELDEVVTLSFPDEEEKDIHCRVVWAGPPDDGADGRRRNVRMGWAAPGAIAPGHPCAGL